MAADRVTVERDAPVAVLWIDNPPVNALSHSVRTELVAALERVEADPDVKGIVLAARGRTFPAGADITEFSAPVKAPDWSALCSRVEACSKPVVAALHGTVLGGGFELALGAHYRIAQRGTQLGFPEIRLGILPGAGGTQRATRLAGPANALALMREGRPIAAASPMARPYIDEITERDVVPSAVRYARRLLASGQGPRRSADAVAGLADPAGFMSEIARHRTATARAPVRAQREIVSAVEAALLLPFEAGLEFERAALAECIATPQAKALQHLFFAERRAAKPPEGKPARVVQLGIAGEGALAMLLTSAALEAGLAVVHLAPSQAAETAVHTALRTALDRAVEARRLSAAARDDRLARLVQSPNPAVIAGSDVIIGCGSVEAQLLSACGPHCGPQTLMVTTGLFHLVGESPLLGLHLGLENDLAEVLWSATSPAGGAATLMALMRRFGRDVVAERSTQPVSAALATHQSALSDVLIGQGAAVADLDATLRALGWHWPLSAERARNGGASNPAQTEAFLRAGMASRAMQLAREGVLARLSDIDVIATRALGYERWSGGPMHAAEVAGFVTLERDIARFAEDHPKLFVPDPALGALAIAGAGWAAFETQDPAAA